MNLLFSALYKDSCLYIVPHSHKVPRTEAQRALSKTLEPPRDPMDMPGAIRVTLQREYHSSDIIMYLMVKLHLIAGETVFYNSNILHCATYDSQQRRATLHGCMGDIRGGSTRARNVLQHGLLWMKEDRFRDTLDEKGKMMLNSLIEMQNSVKEDVGYSLTN
jgi:hypothetical protein